MVEHHSQCKNNEYLNHFYGQQYINQLYNPSEKEIVILEPEEVTKNIMARKIKICTFFKKINYFLKYENSLSR